MPRFFCVICLRALLKIRKRNFPLENLLLAGEYIYGTKSDGSNMQIDMLSMQGLISGATL